MIRPSDLVQAAAARWKPSLAQVPRGGSAGERLGRGVGASMEFHDRRPYQPGDDVRHIDWRAMARTDDVLVRVHQEEVVPRLDVLLDASRSMSVEPGKAQLAVDLAAYFAVAGRASGVDVRLLVMGDRVERRPLVDFEARGIDFDSKRDFAGALHEASAHLRPRSQRVIVSDFLVPMDPASIVRAAARGAGPSAFLQVLGASDLAPESYGAVRLTDAESESAEDIVLDRATIERYHARLDRLTAGIAEEARRLGGVAAIVSGTLEDELEGLAGRGVVEPA